MLESLKQMLNGKILYVLGHNNPDIDSILSCYILTDYLNKIGVKAKFVITDKELEKTVVSICQKYGVDPNQYKGNIPDDSYLFLLDHYKTNVNGKVIGAIDHHPNLEELKYPIYVNCEACSTTKLIYDLINDTTYYTDYLMELTILAILTDTVNFRNTKTNQETIDFVKEEVRERKINYSELVNIAEIVDNIDNPHMAALNGLKTYNYAGKVIKSSYVQIKDVDEKKIKKIITYLKNKVNDIYMWVFIIDDLKENVTYIYEITKDKIQIKKHNAFLSRGITIMPELEKRLMKEGK